MKKNILVVCVFSLIALTTKAQNVIVSPQWLNDNMNDPNLVIIQPSFLKMSQQFQEEVFTRPGHSFHSFEPTV